MDRVPFSHEQELYTKLHLRAGHNKVHGDSFALTYTSLTKMHVLPGQPRIALRDPEVPRYLQKDLSTPDLDRLSPYLLLAAKQDSSRISSLTYQVVQGRKIVVTEKPELHLVWYDDKVFIKPIPKYLLSHAIWEFYLTGNDSPMPVHDRQAVLKAAQGFLRSYSYLIQHRSDFLIAREQHLLPAKIKYSAFASFISNFEQLLDNDTSPRYAFGELRLTRLNWCSQIFLRRLHFHKRYGIEYRTYFTRLFGPLIFVFAVFSVALSAMQVALSVQPLLQPDQSWTIFALVSRGFAVCALACVAIVTLFLILVFLFLSIREIKLTLRNIYNKRKKQVRHRHQQVDDRI